MYDDGFHISQGTENPYTIWKDIRLTSTEHVPFRSLHTPPSAPLTMNASLIRPRRCQHVLGAMYVISDIVMDLKGQKLVQCLISPNGKQA